MTGSIKYKQYEEDFLKKISWKLDYNDFLDRFSVYTKCLDMFINLAYQNKLILRPKKYQSIKAKYQKQLSWNSERVNYCEFLFNPNKFNYKNFDAKWLLKNSYWRMQKLSKIKTVKETLLKNINENDNKELALLYVNYFVKST